MIKNFHLPLLFQRKLEFLVSWGIFQNNVLVQIRCIREEWNNSHFSGFIICLSRKTITVKHYIIQLKLLEEFEFSKCISDELRNLPTQISKNNDLMGSYYISHFSMSLREILNVKQSHQRDVFIFLLMKVSLRYFHYPLWNLSSLCNEKSLKNWK